MWSQKVDGPAIKSVPWRILLLLSKNTIHREIKVQFNQVHSPLATALHCIDDAIKVAKKTTSNHQS